MRAQATQISAVTAAAAHVLCLAGLAAAHALAGRGALVSNPELALRLFVVFLRPFSPLASPPRRRRKLIFGLPILSLF